MQGVAMTTLLSFSHRYKRVMKSRIYLDNNATTPLDPKVFQAMVSEWEESFGNPSSVHSYGQEARNRLTKARRAIASFLWRHCPQSPLGRICRNDKSPIRLSARWCRSSTLVRSSGLPRPNASRRMVWSDRRAGSLAHNQRVLPGLSATGKAAQRESSHPIPKEYSPLRPWGINL